MSEVREFIDELMDRFRAWRLRRRSRREPSSFDATLDVPEIEFTPLDPFAPPVAATPRVFANLTPAWIAAQCDPDVFAQGEFCRQRKQVTRVHARGSRMTGTTYDRQYDDQEIILRDGALSASCTCEQRAPTSSGQNAENISGSPAARTLPCRHVVAILLAYMQSSASAADDTRPPVSASLSGKLVCPVTRQTLRPEGPLLQCSQCGICYSVEGWKFLRKSARGQCCGCESRNTVKEASRDQEKTA